MKKTFLLFFILFCNILPRVYALSGDSTQISLLTVEPRPDEVYTVYGHTAIRIYNPSEKVDVVFNYGEFSFDKPNFLYLFIKGETDYSLRVDDYRYFYYHYASSNSTVTEQVLNILPYEKERMMEMLETNYKPQNREYRYNYYFDNCSTRPRDIIERFCGGRLVYPTLGEKTTFRKLTHECTGTYQWMTFGIDLLIGNGADSTISRRNEQFLPVKLMESMDNAYVVNDTLPQQPIVSSSKVIMTTDSGNESSKTKSWWGTPIAIGFVLFGICLMLSIYGFFYKKTFRFFFFLLFLIAGLAGCIVAFVAFISIHPCTWPNWNLLWIHPLHLIAATGYLFKKTYKVIRWFHCGNFVLLSSLLVGWAFVPQELNAACIPFILCLWISSGYKLLIDKRLNK